MKHVSMWLAGFVMLFSAMALTNANAAEQCETLIAGQNYDAGTVCVSNDTDTITISVTTHDGWTMGETQLALGTSLSDIPTNGPGNPIIGQFPYKTYVDGTSLTYVFDLADFDAACDSNFYIAFHAVASNGDQVETAWSDGERFTARGSWATYSQYQAVCPSNGGDDPIVCTGEDTGYAFGNVELNSMPGVQGNRWGWAISGIERGTENATATVWAGAGQNILANGHEAGSISYTFDENGWLNVDAYANPGYTFATIHLFAGEGYPENVVANGGFPYRLNESEDNDNLVTYANFYGQIEGDVINMIVHFEVKFNCE